MRLAYTKFEFDEDLDWAIRVGEKLRINPQTLGWMYIAKGRLDLCVKKYESYISIHFHRYYFQPVMKCKNTSCDNAQPSYYYLPCDCSGWALCDACYDVYETSETLMRIPSDKWIAKFVDVRSLSLRYTKLHLERRGPLEGEGP